MQLTNPLPWHEPRCEKDLWSYHVSMQDKFIKSSGTNSPMTNVIVDPDVHYPLYMLTQ